MRRPRILSDRGIDLLNIRVDVVVSPIFLTGRDDQVVALHRARWGGESRF